MSQYLLPFEPDARQRPVPCLVASWIAGHLDVVGRMQMRFFTGLVYWAPGRLSRFSSDGARNGIGPIRLHPVLATVNANTVAQPFASAFTDAEVEFSDLAKLTEDDLKELGCRSAPAKSKQRHYGDERCGDSCAGRCSRHIASGVSNGCPSIRATLHTKSGGQRKLASRATLASKSARRIIEPTG